MNGGVAQNEDVAVEGYANYQTEVWLFFLVTLVKTVKCSSEMLRNRSICELERKQETAPSTSRRRSRPARASRMWAACRIVTTR